MCGWFTDGQEGPVAVSGGLRIEDGRRGALGGWELCAHARSVAPWGYGRVRPGRCLKLGSARDGCGCVDLSVGVELDAVDLEGSLAGDPAFVCVVDDSDPFSDVSTVFATGRTSQRRAPRFSPSCDPRPKNGGTADVRRHPVSPPTRTASRRPRRPSRPGRRAHRELRASPGIGRPASAIAGAVAHDLVDGQRAQDDEGRAARTRSWCRRARGSSTLTCPGLGGRRGGARPPRATRPQRAASWGCPKVVRAAWDSDPRTTGDQRVRRGLCPRRDR